MRSPRVLQLIMDSLRYWVLEMHVDGFRFDLASALARELHAVDKLGAFFDIIHQDPVLSTVKLIAEPWDLGEGGYQVGNFPPRWAEWNGKYRDTMRAFWRGDGGDGGGVSELATRLSGSSDLYAQSGRLPYASVNFITSHDGFTMADLVSHAHKHNEANLEGGRDGENHNISWNCGAEGPSADPAVAACRRKHRRNLMTALLLSHGVPMLSGGDELGRTQRGNNNAYCQDNEISWTPWTLDADAQAFLTFVQRLIALRRSQPVLRRRRFFLGRSIRGARVKDVAWLDTAAGEMTDRDWSAPHVRHLGVLLAGDAIDEVDERGRHIQGDSLLILLNAALEATTFSLPAAPGGGSWRLVFDTSLDEGATQELAVAGPYRLDAQTAAVFRTG
jgi:glycogen operon protein